MSEREQAGRNGNPFAPIPDQFAGPTNEVAAALRFPVDSKAAMAEQLGGADALLKVGEENAPVRIWLSFLPAQCFPIASEDNFREKVAELAAMRNPLAREVRMPQETFREAADAFLRDGAIAKVAADVLSAALGSEVAPDRVQQVLERLSRDERALDAIAGAVGRASEVGRQAATTRAE